MLVRKQVRARSPLTVFIGPNIHPTETTTSTSTPIRRVVGGGIQPHTPTHLRLLRYTGTCYVFCENPPPRVSTCLTLRASRTYVRACVRNGFRSFIKKKKKKMRKKTKRNTRTTVRLPNYDYYGAHLLMTWPRRRWHVKKNRL